MKHDAINDEHVARSASGWRMCCGADAAPNFTSISAKFSAMMTLVQAKFD